MTADLMDTVKGMLTPEVVARAADSAGETPDVARKTLVGAVPTIFAGLAHCASAPGGAGRVFGMLTESGATSQGLMRNVFGERGGAVSEALAKSSGAKSDSASRMLSLALPMVAGLLGKHIVSNRLSPGGMSQQLFSQKKAILDDPNTPPGLASALGIGSLSELGGTEARGEAPHAKRRIPWGAVVPALILIGGLAIWGVFSPKHAQVPHVGVTAPQPTMPTVAPRLPELPAVPPPELSAAPHAETPPSPGAEAPAGMAPIPLPGGKTLDVEANSPEADMAHYLSDVSTSLPHTFQLSGLVFESGTATVTADSTKTLDDLAAMLQSYPSSRVRIEGHTDDVGDPATNQTLSETRAHAIKEVLMERGIASDRIETGGHSEQAPVADNDTEEGRARNRRADVVLINR